jgi:hypothetical protein
MTSFVSFVKNIVHPSTKKTLGRWTMDPCIIKTHQKVDLANEDHCGPCGSKEFPKYHTNPNYSESKKIYKDKYLD